MDQRDIRVKSLTDNLGRNQGKNLTKDMHNSGSEPVATRDKTRKGYTKSQTKKQKEAWRNRIQLNEVKNPMEEGD